MWLKHKMFLFCFTKILNQAFYMTHIFNSEVSLHYWLLWPTVRRGRPACSHPTWIEAGLWSKPNAEFERTMAFLRQQLFGAMMMTWMFLVIEFQVTDMLLQWREVFTIFHSFLSSSFWNFQWNAFCVILSPVPNKFLKLNK